RHSRHTRKPRKPRKNKSGRGFSTPAALVNHCVAVARGGVLGSPIETLFVTPLARFRGCYGIAKSGYRRGKPAFLGFARMMAQGSGTRCFDRFRHLPERSSELDVAQLTSCKGTRSLLAQLPSLLLCQAGAPDRGPPATRSRTNVQKTGRYH